MDYVLELGIGGLFAILVIKIVFDFLLRKKNCRVTADACIECREMVARLYEMHNRKDNDGVYVWYVRRSLEEAIVKLGENIDKQTVVFERLVMRLETKFDAN
jgi:hypothetical protein